MKLKDMWIRKGDLYHRVKGNATRDRVVTIDAAIRYGGEAGVFKYSVLESFCGEVLDKDGDMELLSAIPKGKVCADCEGRRE